MKTEVVKSAYTAGACEQARLTRISGARMVLEALAREDVDTIWGYPGGAVLPFYDALGQQEKIEHILVRHEQAAVHAADGYARATGKVGVALVTSGPGVTNAV
ncbi:thiamine pyrophosphate-binding protein, partial [Pandoraea sp. ISTKB]